MSQETTYAGQRGGWRDLLEPFTAKPPGLEHLEPFCSKLQAKLDRSIDLTKQQADLSAQKQEISKELRQVMIDGERLAVILRKGLKQQFGPDAEKLTAFQVQPFRGRKAKDKVKKTGQATVDSKDPAESSQAR
jgi:hypothetical protein